MPLPNVLHLGVHKTATSHLQDFLASHFGDEERGRPRFVPTREFRTKVTRPLKEKKNAAQRVQATLDEYLSAPVSNIFSDENLIGSARQMMQRRLYQRPDFAQTVIGRLGPAPLGVVLVIRDPLTFLPSLYSEYLRHNPFVEFDEWAPDDQIQALKYRERFSWLESLPSNVGVSVVPFEPSHGGGLDRVLMALLSFLKLDANEQLRLTAEYRELKPSSDQRIARSGFSVEELERLRAIAREVDGNAAKEFALELQTSLQRFGSTKFAPFSDDQLRRITTEYRADVTWAASLSKG